VRPSGLVRMINEVRIARERNSQFGTVIEFHQEKFVVGVGGSEERCRGFGRFTNLVAHASAGIKQQPDGHGRIFARKVGDLLLYAVLEDAEVFLFQIHYGRAQLRGDVNGNQGERNVHTQIRHGHGFRWQASRDGSVVGKLKCQRETQKKCGGRNHSGLV
jgi:hypothetical protein